MLSHRETPYRQLALENEALKRKVTELEKENKELKTRISKILSPSEGMINHEDVADEYEELFETIFDLPDNIPGHPANDVWITFEKMFQKAYTKCQTIILEKFMESLKFLTELQAEEEKSSRSRKRLDKSLFLFKKAYNLLLEGTGFKEPAMNQAMQAEHEIRDFVQHDLPNASPELITAYVSGAIRVAWKMLTLNPPAIICKPKKYSERWHEEFRKKWHEDYRHYNLVYYRPVMLYGAGGTVAVKGKVGNKLTVDSKDCVKAGEGSSTEAGHNYGVPEEFPVCDTSVTNEGDYCGEQNDICGTPITDKVKGEFQEENDVPVHPKYILCPVCKHLCHDMKTPTGEFCYKKYFDAYEHCICCACKKQFSEAEMGIRLPCCGNWCHETCQHTITECTDKSHSDDGSASDSSV